MPGISEKTARGRQFMPGQSGNPGGRPRMTDEQRAAAITAREFTADAIKTLIQIMKDPKASASARVSAACAILDRGWGRAPQTVEIGNKNGQPLEIKAGMLPEEATRIYLERVRGQGVGVH